MSTLEGPALILVAIGSVEVACSSSAGPSCQPVAVISTTGVHPRHGFVALKLGSVISWWPLGSPICVFAGGMGRRPWSVDVITDVTVVPTPDEVVLRLASGEGGAEGIGLGPPPEGAEGIGGIEIGPDGAGGEKDGAWVDGNGIG
jgi:hypothetical protein